MGSAAPQKLKLVMVKGPREGETIEYPPGSKFKIGRLVRGKNISIKDDGVSSTHLEIVSDTSSSSSQSQWFLKDLDSSNGTTLNNSSSSLPPNKPFLLRDGDVIKLGESTSILVRLLSVDARESVEVSENLRRKRENVAGAKQQQIEGRRTRAATRARGDDLHQFSELPSTQQTDTKNEGRRKRATARARQIDPNQLVQSQAINQTNVDKANLGMAVLSDSDKELGVMVKEEVVGDLEEVVVIKENPRRGRPRNARRIGEEHGMQQLPGRQGLPGLSNGNDDVHVAGDKEIQGERNNREELNLEEDSNMPDLNGTSAATRARGDDLHQLSELPAGQQIDTKNENRKTQAGTRVRQDAPNQLAQSQAINRTDMDRVNSGSAVLSDSDKEVRVVVKEEVVDDIEEVVVIKENPRRGRPRNARRIDGEQGTQQLQGRHDLPGLPPMDLSNRTVEDHGDLGIDAQNDNDDVGIGGDKEIEEETENRDELNLEEVRNMVDLKETSGANEGVRGSVEELRKEREALNLEKMTLGEWFGYLEVHLPRQIIDPTEKMIEEMQRKSERIHAYMMELGKNKTSHIAE